MKARLNGTKFYWLWVALLFLLFVSVVSACSSSTPSTVVPVSDQPDKSPQNTKSEVAKIAAAILKDDIGEINLVGDSVSDKKVIVFEERHDSRTGQLEIAIMLTRLYNEYDVKYIALEGALAKDGPLDLGWYHQLSDKETLADVAVQILREGEVSSAEFMAMALPDVTVKGIETPEDYAVELDDNAGSAPTLYLFYIAVSSLKEDEMAKFNELYEADKVKEAVEFVINTDEWTQSQYEKITASNFSVEELVKVLEEIEAKANEVNADVNEELKTNFQNYKHFFEVASRRSDTMMDNTLALLNEHPDTPIAMIIGAAHTAKISDLLDSQGISHVVIKPKALATEEPGELTSDAYERKLQALSVDEKGGLGALLDGRKKPPPVVQQRWFQIESGIKVVAIKIARAAAAGGKPPFDKPPYDLQTEFASYSPHVSVNWDSIEIIDDDEPKKVILSFDVQIDGKTKRVWVGAVQRATTNANPADRTLEQLLLDTLNEVRSENENPATTLIAHDVSAIFSESRDKIIERINEI